MNFFDIIYAKKNGAALPANFFDLLFAKSFTPAIEWGEYDGTLPAQYSANGSMLAGYRICGAAGGVGDDSGTAYGYVIPISVSDGTTSTTTPIYIGSDPLGEDEYVDYVERKVYRRTKNLVGIFESVEINGLEFKFDGAMVYISGTARAVIPANNQLFKAFIFTLKAGTYNIREFRHQQPQSGFGGWILYDLNSTRIVYSNNTFTLGEDTEVFFGFYIVANTVIDMSIGFVILSESEGAITEYIPYYDPQDPPVPLPQLPTVDGVTITDYAGQSAAPSRFYAKYQKG